MGSLFSSWLQRRLMPRCEFGRLVMVGLDGAGKTTILYKLRLGEFTSAAPTIGFNVESVKVNNCEFTVWDVGGQEKIRPLWRHYFQNCYGLVFVIDSCDLDRIDEAHREIQALLQDVELREAPFLILANKQDLPDAISTRDVAKHLGLLQVSNHMWFVQSASGMSGEGLQQGFEWLSSNFWKGSLKDSLAPELVRVANLQTCEARGENSTLVCLGLGGETLATINVKLDETLDTIRTVLHEHMPSGCWHIILPLSVSSKENEAIGCTDFWFRNIAFLAQDGTPLQTKDIAMQLTDLSFSQSS